MMKKQTRRILFLFTLLPLVFSGFNSYAEGTLSAGNKDILKKAGIPLYSGLRYVNGGTGDITSMRFASTDDVKTVRDWYRKSLPKWALNDEYGSWILYNGKPGGGPANYMTKNQVMVMENKNLQQWFGLPASMTTEVVINIPSNQ